MDKKKILVALILLPLFIWLIGWGSPGLLLPIVLLLGAGLGGWESAKLAFGEGDFAWRCMGTLLSMSLCYGASIGDEMAVIIVLLTGFLFAMLFGALLSDDLSLALSRAAKLMFVAVYPGLLAGYLVALKRYEPIADGSKLLMILFALVWVNDSGAYFAGNLFGKRKMTPHISPNKTWEGAIGGFVASVVLGFFIGSSSTFLNYKQGLLLGFVLGLVAPVGDLVESAFKRSAGVKDSGTLLPGHGGILDRVDSVIFCAPLFYYYIVISHYCQLMQQLK